MIIFNERENTMNNMQLNAFNYEMIYNSNSLNIFSDASMRNKGKNKLDASYGAVAVCRDDMVDSLYRMQTDCTVPAAEIRGIRCSLVLALKWRHCFQNINIFSDSLISVRMLRDSIPNWYYIPSNEIYQMSRTNSNIPKNQELFIECYNMLQELRRTNNVSIYHQKGHIDNGLGNIRDALESFKKHNHIQGKIDYNVIRYISTYNNLVDNQSRSIIRRTNVYDNLYRDPVSFHIIQN